MKSAIEFRKESASLREQVIETILARREEVKELFLKQFDGLLIPDGDIQLTDCFIHSYIDDQSNEVVRAISTDGERCLLDTGHDSRYIVFRELSTSGLIYLLLELEDMIKNPETIDII